MSEGVGLWANPWLGMEYVAVVVVVGIGSGKGGGVGGCGEDDALEGEAQGGQWTTGEGV